MHKVMEASEKLIEEALRGLKRGYNAEDLKVLGEAIDIIKDVKTIEAMDGDYELEIEGGYGRLKDKNKMPAYHLEKDENVEMICKHMEKFVAFRKEYKRTGGELDKTKSMRELDKMMDAVYDLMEEIKDMELSSDEKEAVRSKIKEIHSMFS